MADNVAPKMHANAIAERPRALIADPFLVLSREENSSKAMSAWNIAGCIVATFGASRHVVAAEVA
jgi:hypothetical protein